MPTSLHSATAGAVTMLALLFLILPLAVVVLFSFHETASLSFPFTGFSLRWYREVFASAEFRQAMQNSFVVAAAVSATTLVLGTAAAYGLSRSNSRLRDPLALLFFLPITLPGLFLGLAMLVFFVGIDVQLSLATVAIGHFIYVFPYFLLIAKAALDRMDPAIEEAAADLGAGPWTVFYRVTLPQIWPVLAAATSLAFALSFDEFVITFFVIGSQSTLPLYVWSGLRRTIDPSINTISTLLMAVTLILFAIAFAFVVRSERARARRAMPESLPAAVQA
jgi:spermidine/putrescine transport system permease protein